MDEKKTRNGQKVTAPVPGLARRLQRKISTTARVVLLFKNWPYLFSVFLGVSKGAEIECVLRNGTRFKVPSTSDPIMICNIWSRRTWTPNGDEIQAYSTVVDIGAYIGAFSILAATSAEGIRVVSYEPNPKSFESLVSNVRLNALENVEPLLLAVAGSAEKRRLFVDDGGEGSSLMGAVSGSCCQLTEDVDCTTLTEVIRYVGKCDLLKINCEGAEYEILFNTPEESLRQVRRMVVDCHQVRGYDVEDLKDHLEKAGFTVRLVAQHKQSHVHLHAMRRLSLAN
jgi:FkbM family methyltransferase